MSAKNKSFFPTKETNSPLPPIHQIFFGENPSLPPNSNFWREHPFLRYSLENPPPPHPPPAHQMFFRENPPPTSRSADILWTDTIPPTLITFFREDPPPPPPPHPHSTDCFSFFFFMGSFYCAFLVALLPGECNLR